MQTIPLHAMPLFGAHLLRRPSEAATPRPANDPSPSVMPIDDEEARIWDEIAQIRGQLPRAA